MPPGNIGTEAGEGSEPEGGGDAGLRFEGKSELVSQLRGLPDRHKALLHLDDWLLELVDGIVTVAIDLAAASNTGSLRERIENAVDRFPDLGTHSDTLTAKLEYWGPRLKELDPDLIPRWVKRLSSDGHWKRFLRKLLGAAQYDRLVRALLSDCAAVAEGLRGVMHHLEPFAVAFDDIVGVLTPEQIQAIWDLPGGLTKSAFRLVLQLDQAMENLIASKFDWSVFGSDGDFEDALDLGEIIEQVRPLISNPLRDELSDINEKLTRKLNGALTALDLSDDGVSQAANSIVELIDRLLRKAFNDDEVLAWLTATDRGEGAKFTYRKTEDSDFKPTKKAQVLCFVYGGRVTDESVVHEVLAAALIAVRNDLQKLKHADSDDPAEEATMRKCITAVEGFLTLSIRLAWSGLPSETVDTLRVRLAG